MSGRREKWNTGEMEYGKETTLPWVNFPQQFDVMWLLTKECRKSLELKQGKDFYLTPNQALGCLLFRDYNFLNFNIINSCCFK